MKTTQLIEKLQKLESENPGSEIGFFLEGTGSGSSGFNITFTDQIAKSHESYGPVWKLQFFTERVLPK